MTSRPWRPCSSPSLRSMSGIASTWPRSRSRVSGGSPRRPAGPWKATRPLADSLIPGRSPRASAVTAFGPDLRTRGREAHSQRSRTAIVYEVGASPMTLRRSTPARLRALLCGAGERRFKILQLREHPLLVALPVRLRLGDADDGNAELLGALPNAGRDRRHRLHIIEQDLRLMHAQLVVHLRDRRCRRLLALLDRTLERLRRDDAQIESRGHVGEDGLGERDRGAAIPAANFRDPVLQRTECSLEQPEPVVERAAVGGIDLAQRVGHRRRHFGHRPGIVPHVGVIAALVPTSVPTMITFRAGFGAAFIRRYMKSSYPSPFITTRLARATAAPSRALLSYSCGSTFGSLMMLVMET